MNLCAACRADFTSVRLFDAHRVGVHAYTFAEGLRLEPPVENGRRCLSEEEMLGKGWAQNEKGRWYDPAHVEQARQAFREAA